MGRERVNETSHLPADGPPLLEIHLFFFSSRRRHTRCSRDWSSDVCSSDLSYRNPESHNAEIRCTRDNHSPISTLERHAASDPVDTGSLVLATHEPARSFSQLGQESFTELHRVTGQLESALAKAFNYDKLNYLMLIMVDPDVHFHVIPRYAEPGDFSGVKFVDSGGSEGARPQQGYKD